MIGRLSLADVFGQSSVALRAGKINQPGKAIKVIGMLFEFGFNCPRRLIADVTGLSEAAVYDIIYSYRSEINGLISDAQQLGFSTKDIAYLMQSPLASDSMVHRFLDALRQMRVARNNNTNIGPILSPAWDEIVESAWREYRTNASFRGVAPDDLEIHPPRWFKREISEMLSEI